MNPNQLYERRGEVQIVDVREPEEWKAGRIPEASHISMDDLPKRLGELDRSRPVSTVCRSGERSGEMADFLKGQGFQAENM